MCNISLDHGFYLKLYQGYITLTILICNSENKIVMVNYLQQNNNTHF